MTTLTPAAMPIAKMILSCLKTPYIQESFLQAVHGVQVKMNPHEDPCKTASTHIKQAELILEMFTHDLVIEDRLGMIVDTAISIVNGGYINAEGQSIPTKNLVQGNMLSQKVTEDFEHGQNQQVLPGDLTVSEGHVSNIRHTNEYKAMYESLVGRVGEMAERVKGQSATLPDPGNTFIPPTFKG